MDNEKVNPVQLFLHPYSCGPAFVSRRNNAGAMAVVLLHSALAGLVALGAAVVANNSIHAFILRMGEMIAHAVKMTGESIFSWMSIAFVPFIRRIPLIGDFLGDYGQSLAESAGPDLVDKMVNGINGYIDRMTQAIHLPIGASFALEFSAVMGTVLFTTLLFLLFAVITRHKWRRFGEMFRLSAVRCTVSIPFCALAAVFAWFRPGLAIALYAITTLWGAIAMYTVLVRGASDKAGDRGVWLYPIAVILIFVFAVVLSLITLAVNVAVFLFQLAGFLLY